ncbi:MAG: hypothetical protein A2046_00685 [Bacteroidetes bacterium GWA2_30_7]|nr:MAG: hypothetical protein A2046_00685 [Bacteroidetes bacterium GWA2_30_7]
MSFSKDISLGFSSYSKAFNILFRHNLWWTLFIPLILYLILLFTGFELKDYIADYLKTNIIESTNLENADFFLSSYIKGTVSWIIGFSFTIIFFFVFSFFGGYLIIILMSPLLAYLSEKTEEIVTGKEYPFDIMQFTRDIFRGILLALRNMLIQTGIFLAIIVICLVPVLGWIVSIISSIFLFFISAYFYGFSFMDYSNERQRLNISKSVEIIRKYKWVAITNGGIFGLSLIIPFCGATIAPFFAIFSVIAASIAMTKIYQNESSMINNKHTGE